MSWFDKLLGAAATDTELPEIFPFSVVDTEFIKIDIVTTYTKILTDTVARVHGLSEVQKQTLWDSCVQTDANAGLISLLADAMAEKKEIFLVFKVGVLRKATSDEERQIKEDYKARSSSNVGAWISFKNYKRTDMLKIYSGFEYCVIASLNKNLNTSKALQIKIGKLRESVSLQDSAVAKSQAKTVATSLGKGRDVLLDSTDSIETATPDTSSSEKSMMFLDAKRAFYLGLPLAYIAGEQTAGLNTSGEADTRAVERGLHQYFVSILHPVLKAIFNVDTKFKSQDFRQITSSLDVLKTFDLVTDDYLDQAQKQEIIAQLFDLEDDTPTK